MGGHRSWSVMCFRSPCGHPCLPPITRRARRWPSKGICEYKTRLHELMLNSYIRLSYLQLYFLVAWLILSGIFALVAPICSEVWELRSFQYDYQYLCDRAQSQSSSSLASSKRTPSRNAVAPSTSGADTLQTNTDKDRRISFSDEKDEK